MKKFSLLSFVLLLLLLLSSCGEKKVRTDVDALSVVSAMKAVTDQSNKTVEANADYIADLLQIDLSLCADYAVMVPDSTTNMDEFGVFKALDEEKAAELRKQVDDYLALRNRQWMPEYLPEEYPKIKNAESESGGIYVCYCILSDSYRDAAFDAFSDALKG